MKVNRRRLFGVGAGAAVAGPSVLGEIAAAAGTLAAGVGAIGPPTTPYHPFGPSTLEAKQAASADYIAGRVAKLKRIVAGEVDQSDLNYPTGAPYVGPYEPLKSVSRSAVRFMTLRHEEKQHRQRMIENAIKELAQLDPTGIVRSVL